MKKLQPLTSASHSSLTTLLINHVLLSPGRTTQILISDGCRCRTRLSARRTCRFLSGVKGTAIKQCYLAAFIQCSSPQSTIIITQTVTGGSSYLVVFVHDTGEMSRGCVLPTVRLEKPHRTSSAANQDVSCVDGIKYLIETKLVRKKMTFEQTPA